MRARAVRVHHALLGAWLVAVAAVTLRPTTGPARQLSVCLACGEFGLSELLLNVLLFMPLGVLVARSREVTRHARGASRPLRDALLLGAFLSLAIEMVQWIAGIGRVSALGDLLANASGALIGSALYRHRLLLWAPHGTWRRRLIAGWLVVIGLNLAFGYWSSTPWLPEGRWYLQRTPLRPWSDVYAGELEFAGIGAVDVPSDRIRDTALINGVRRGDHAIVAVERIGPPTERLAYVLRLVEADRGLEVFSLARVGDDAVLHTLTNAARVRAASVSLRVVDAYRRGTEAQRSSKIWLGRREPHAVQSISEYGRPAASALRAWAAFLPRPIAMRPQTLRALDGLHGLILAAPLLIWLVPSLRRSQIGMP